MKVVILNGSPDKKGVTKQITDYVFADIDCEISEHWSYYSDIKPCVDCQYCFRNPNLCVIKDDFQNMMEDFREADLIVLASPLHFSSFTGKLLTSISRMQYLFALKYIHNLESDFTKKRGLTIVTGGNDYHNMFQAIDAVDKIIYDHMNVENIDRLLIKATDKDSVENIINMNLSKIDEIRKYIRG